MAILRPNGAVQMVERGRLAFKSLQGVAICPDLLHTFIDIAETLMRWHICCAEGCGTDQASNENVMQRLADL